MPRADLEEWADNLFLTEYKLLKRKTFSCPSYYKGKKLFTFIYKDGLGIKLSPEKVLQKIAENPEVYSHFHPGDGVMKNWLIITYPEASEYDQEKGMIEQALQSL